MKKLFIVVTLLVFILLLFASCSTLASIFSRTKDDGPDHVKPVLGIMPFYGGAAGEGGTIAEIFSHQPALLQHFTVVTRSSAALETIYAEHNLQRLTGLTDSDAIAGVGRVLNADFVLSGSIRRLGDKNLLIATLVNVKTLEQIAGTYTTYSNINEVPSLLPGLSKEMAEFTVKRENVSRENLAIVPIVPLHTGISREDAYTLTQILAIELIRTQKYSILPRTSAIQAARTEHGFQEGGDMAAMGRAINAELVLSGNIGILGVQNVFSSQIIRVIDASIVMGKNENFTVITEGIHLMPEMAILLTELDENRAQVQIARMRKVRAAEEAKLQKKQEQEKRKQEAQAAKITHAKEREAAKERNRQNAANKKTQRIRTADQRLANAKRSELEFFAISYAWGNVAVEENGQKNAEKTQGIKFMAFLSGAYWSPLPYFNVGIEPSFTLFGLEKENGPGPKDIFFSLAPSIGTVVPLGEVVRIFVNFAVDMGHLPGGGTFFHVPGDNVSFGISPGFNAGFSFGREGTFNIKYDCSLNGQKDYGELLLSHSIGIGFGRRF